MVVSCRTQQLLKTGKNVTISKNFSYSTGNVNLSFKKYIEKKVVPRNDIPKVRLYDFKRFHSSRESRSTLAKLTPQELVSSTLSESKWIESVQVPSEVNINPLLANPRIKDYLLESILRNRGTSLVEIQEIIDAADGDLEEVVRGVNTAVKLDVLVFDDDVIRINPSALKTLVKETIQGSFNRHFSSKPDWASSLQKNIYKEIEAGSVAFDSAIQKSAIPAAFAQKQLVESRRRRSTEAQPGLDLARIISDLVSTIIRSTLGGVLNGLLENLKATVSGFLIVTAPGDPLGDFLAGVVNFAVKGILQVITSIQQSILNVFPSNSTETGTVERRKREVAVTVSDQVSGSGGGILDGILSPIITLLLNILTPVRDLAVSITNSAFDIIQAILGPDIVSPIRNTVVAVINGLIPANPA